MIYYIRNVPFQYKLTAKHLIATREANMKSQIFKTHTFDQDWSHVIK